MLVELGHFSLQLRKVHNRLSGRERSCLASLLNTHIWTVHQTKGDLFSSIRTNLFFDFPNKTVKL